MDIVIQKKGKQWYTVIPQNDSAREFLKTRREQFHFFGKVVTLSSRKPSRIPFLSSSIL